MGANSDSNAQRMSRQSSSTRSRSDSSVSHLPVPSKADSSGPVLVVAVPPIRKSMGWKPTERIPTTFPGTSQRNGSITDGQFPTDQGGQ